jgi:uncharacterized FAD-dependent dehydrogenase
MQKIISLKLLPSEAADDAIIKNHIAQTTATKKSSVSGFIIVKRSIDARGRQVWINLSVQAFIDEPFQPGKLQRFDFRDANNSTQKVLIVGAGPAGLFAALRLLESGIKPIILERGKDVKARRRDLAILNKQGIVNPESNYCFGEGGAGTYSDGKLYTRSSKRGDVYRVLNLFVHFGADENILYESHPHIGTNKLPNIITSIRKKIIECGGEIHFEKKVTDFIIKKEKIAGVKTNDTSFEGDAVIVATGHSARDIFQLLHSKNIQIGFKSFALGVRVEHPQSLIDSAQYHCSSRGAFLPPASYSLAEQVDGKGVFSFCMCPGGIIAPAATAPGEVVVNGWSPSKRNNPYANSGIVVSVEEKDLQAYKKYGPLAGMFFQQEVEQKAFLLGGGNVVAPAQRLVDFTENKMSASLPDCSYLPGIRSISLKEVLPNFIHKRLQIAFKEFGKKMPARFGGSGYFTNDAVVVATESRTSSPVRIPRNEETLQHPQIKNLYPCGEGAGYAGGIVSAAMDGEKVATQIANALA